MEETQECKREGCSCKVPKERAARGDAYCSERCAQMATPTGHEGAQCNCGHVGCHA